MKLREAIDRYVAWQRSHGAKFESSAFVLNLFLKSIDEETGPIQEKWRRPTPFALLLPRI